MKVHLTEVGVRSHAECVAGDIVAHGTAVPCLYGVPTGGLYALVEVCHALSAANVRFTVTADPKRASHIIDDIIDSGATRDRVLGAAPHAVFLALVDKPADGLHDWYVFPWEKDTIASATDMPRRLLQFIGEDVNRGGLQETPERFLKAWVHYTSGYACDPCTLLKTFEDGAENYDELVVVRDISVYSHCEHHLAPFWGVAHVGYIPNGRIVGLSKLARVVDGYMRRLQVQERLTNQIATAIEEELAPLGVAVVLKCRHMCMEARGVQQRGATTLTSAMRGAFREPAPRAEFFKLVEGSNV